MSLLDDLDAIELTARRGSRVATVGRVVFGLSFFLRAPGSRETRQRIIAAANHLISVVPLDHYRWWLLHGEGNPKRLPQSSPPSPSDVLELSGAGPEKPFALKLWDSEPHDAAAPKHYLEFFCLSNNLADQNVAPLGTVQFYVPLQWVERQPPGTPVNLFRQLAQRLQPFHGTAGLTLSSPVTPGWQQSAGATLFEFLHRFPGLETGYAWQMSAALAERMGPVNWLTAVHSSLLDLCGGVETVTQKLPAKLYPISDYGDGVIIQAGPGPQLGDREEQIPIPTYRTVADALRPARAKYDGMVINPGVHPPDSEFNDSVLDEGQIEYLTRFD